MGGLEYRIDRREDLQFFGLKYQEVPTWGGPTPSDNQKPVFPLLPPLFANDAPAITFSRALAPSFKAAA